MFDETNILHLNILRKTIHVVMIKRETDRHSVLDKAEKLCNRFLIHSGSPHTEWSYTFWFFPGAYQIQALIPWRKKGRF